MGVKLNSRTNILVNIGGIDFSKELDQCSASYSSLNLPDSGLVTMTGSLNLMQTEDTGIDFDTRFNQLWARGTQISLTYQGQNLPVCGRAYIISSDYDMQSSLSVSFGCLLSLYNFRSRENVGVCLPFGASYPVGEAIRSLLIAAGVPAGSIELGSIFDLNRFLIVEPLQIGPSQSLLQAAGRLAGQYGGYLVQRADGLVGFELLTRESEYIHYHTAEEVQTYQRVSQPETVVSQYIFNYNLSKVINVLGTESDSLQFGDTKVSVSETRDIDNRSTSSIIEEFRNINNTSVLISQSIVNSQYEAPSAAAIAQSRAGEIIGLDACYPDSDTARLVFRETITTSDNTEVLRAWAANKAAASTPTNFNVSGVITKSKVTETYSYTATKVTRVTDEFQAAGVAIPIIGDLKLGRDTDPNQINDIDPESLIIATRIVETWTKAQDFGTKYNYLKATFRNRYLASPEELTDVLKDTSQSLQSILNANLDLVPVGRESTFNQDLPQFSTFASQPEVAKEARELRIGADPINPFEVSTNISLGDFDEFDSEYFTDYCSRIMDFSNGRIYGMQVAFNLFDFSDTWGFVLPGRKGKVKEPSHLRQNTASVFYIDTPTVTISAEEAILSYVGAFAGFSNDPLNTSIQNDFVQVPPTLPSSQPIETLSFDSVRYTVTSSLNYTIS